MATVAGAPRREGEPDGKTNEDVAEDAARQQFRHRQGELCRRDAGRHGAGHERAREHHRAHPLTRPEHRRAEHAPLRSDEGEQHPDEHDPDDRAVNEALFAAGYGLVGALDVHLREFFAPPVPATEERT